MIHAHPGITWHRKFLRRQRSRREPNHLFGSWWSHGPLRAGPLSAFQRPVDRDARNVRSPFVTSQPVLVHPSAPTWGTRCTALSDLTPHHESVIRSRCLVPIRTWAESFEWPPEIRNSRRVRSPSNGLPGRRGTVQFCVATPQSPSSVPSMLMSGIFF
jgi:hypothetical protein